MFILCLILPKFRLYSQVNYPFLQIGYGCYYLAVRFLRKMRLEQRGDII